jgi:hypothetical protein
MKHGAPPACSGVKRCLLRQQIGNHLFDPIDRGLIAYRLQNSSIPLNGFVNLDALLTHALPPLIRRSRHLLF